MKYGYDHQAGWQSLQPMDDTDAPQRLEQIAMIVAAVLLRALICAIICHRGHLSLNQYSRLYDGNSYIITARAMCGDYREFNDYHGRVFPGFPALIALAHLTGLSFETSAIGIDWISAAVAAVLAAKFFNDRRVGWGMVLLIPHYLMNSALAMSESPLLMFTLAGLLLMRQKKECLCAATTARSILGGGLLGIAGMIRPMACFGLGAFFVGEWLDHRTHVSSSKPISEAHRSTRFFRGPIPLFGVPQRPAWGSGQLAGIYRALISTIAAIIVVGCGFILVHHWRGSALAGLRYAASSPNTYGGDLFTWPFHALLTVPIQRHVPIGRVLYIWAHVILTLCACAVIIRRCIRTKDRLDFCDAMAGPWLWCNTLFVLCIGNIWGFECFHRFTIPALPALFWAIRSILPRRMWGWILIAVVSTAIAVLTLLHDLPGQMR